MYSHHSPFSISVAHEAGFLLLHLAGELDMATGPVLRRTIDDLVKPPLLEVILDLRDLTFVDATGLRALLYARQATVSVSAEFQISSVSDVTHRVIRLVNYKVLEDAIVGVAGTPVG